MTKKIQTGNNIEVKKRFSQRVNRLDIFVSCGQAGAFCSGLALFL